VEEVKTLLLSLDYIKYELKELETQKVWN